MKIAKKIVQLSMIFICVMFLIMPIQARGVESNVQIRFTVLEGESLLQNLTVRRTEGGTLTGGANQTFEVEAGTVFDLPTAAPNAHFRFARWEFVGDVNGATLQNPTSQADATVTMGTGATTVQAVFERATDSGNSSDEHKSQGRLPQSGVTSSGGVLLLGFGISLIVTGVVMSLKRHSNKRH